MHFEPSLNSNVCIWTSCKRLKMCNDKADCSLILTSMAHLLTYSSRPIYLTTRSRSVGLLIHAGRLFSASRDTTNFSEHGHCAVAKTDRYTEQLHGRSYVHLSDVPLGYIGETSRYPAFRTDVRRCVHGFARSPTEQFIFPRC